jgi:cytochrome b561
VRRTRRRPYGAVTRTLHVASHVAFFVALAAHLGLVLKHQVIDRDRLGRRMF